MNHNYYLNNRHNLLDFLFTFYYSSFVFFHKGVNVMYNNNEDFQFTGPAGSFSIPKGDNASKKLAMLIEVK